MLQTLKNSPVVLPLRKILYERKFANHQNVHYFRGSYESFNAALRSAPNTKPKGYDNPDSAKLYKERTKILYSTDYPVLFWMEKINHDVSRIFDFGGHIGVHYYSYPKVLNFSKIKEWTVCDVESVCNEGKVFADRNDSLGRLNFVTDIKSCEGYDLFLANGSLQYLEWELHSKLKELSNPPKYLIINMTPLHPSNKTITLNNIGTSFCPYHIRRDDDFFKGLKQLGYTLLDDWKNEEKSCRIAFEPSRSLSFYRGAVLKLDYK